MRLFKKSNKNYNIEKQLEDLYTDLLEGIGISRKEVKKAIKDCKIKAKLEGTDKMFPNSGDYLIDGAKAGNEKCKRFIQKSYAGGANEDDVRHWWNLHDLERRMIQYTDNLFRISAFEGLIQDGLTEVEAAEQIKKEFPYYGDPMDESKPKGEDRPLAEELHDRINYLTIKLTPEYIKEHSQDYSSMNAFLRHHLNKEDNK